MSEQIKFYQLFEVFVQIVYTPYYVLCVYSPVSKNVFSESIKMRPKHLQ